MSTWLRQHWQTFGLTLRRLARNPLATLLNVMVIGVALALPLGGYMLLQNLSSVSRQLTRNPQVSLFLALDASKADITALEGRLKQIPGVRALRFISREQALHSLKQSEDLSDVIAALQTNPLPDAFVLETGGSAAELEQLEPQLKALPKVAHVQLDSAWVKRLESLLELGRMAVLVLATLLAGGLVAVTFNTIRLQILTQKDEIAQPTPLSAAPFSTWVSYKVRWGAWPPSPSSTCACTSSTAASSNWRSFTARTSGSVSSVFPTASLCSLLPPFSVGSGLICQ